MKSDIRKHSFISARRKLSFTNKVGPYTRELIAVLGSEILKYDSDNQLKLPVTWLKQLGPEARKQLSEGLGIDEKSSPLAFRNSL